MSNKNSPSKWKQPPIIIDLNSDNKGVKIKQEKTTKKFKPTPPPSKRATKPPPPPRQTKPTSPPRFPRPTLLSYKTPKKQPSGHLGYLTETTPAEYPKDLYPLKKRAPFPDRLNSFCFNPRRPREQIFYQGTVVVPQDI